MRRELTFDSMTAFVLPRAWLTELHARAQREGTSASAILRRALRVELDAPQKASGPRRNAGHNNHNRHNSKLHDGAYPTVVS
jgi:hypothetical protein